ncbi:unnamed protein product [Rhizopus microsporus]
MTQSSSLRFFGNFRDKKPTKETTENKSPDNVQGWLMNVHSFQREDKQQENNDIVNIVDADNNRIPIEKTKRKDGRPESIASEDSVNLEELINANYTADMDDETDLLDLADLNLIDDSADDFWQLNKTTETLNSFDSGYNDYVAKPVELGWNTPNSTKPTMTKQLLNSPSNKALRKRSDSLSSDNSLTSQSTITQYAKYGMTPMIYPSESSSSSSRPLSRLSNYSASSLASSSGLPRSSGTGIPTPSRSYTTKKETRIPNTTRTQLAKRASHIPAPVTYSPPTPQKTTSSSSSSATIRKSKIPQQRASHIPTRPLSPQQQQQQRSLFEEAKRVSPTTNRPSGLRAPATVRSISRIGTVKKM